MHKLYFIYDEAFMTRQGSSIYWTGRIFGCPLKKSKKSNFSHNFVSFYWHKEFSCQLTDTKIDNNVTNISLYDLAFEISVWNLQLGPKNLSQSTKKCVWRKFKPGSNPLLNKTRLSTDSFWSYFDRASSIGIRFCHS